jgi:hypothetical protein
MMRIFLILTLLVGVVNSFTVVNYCNAPQDYVDALETYLQQAYDMYSREVKTPALCPDFRVELKNDVQYPAVTYSRIGPLGVCAYKMEIRCGISRAWLQHLAFHEMAHALQNAVGDGGKGYGWWSEAHAEGLASYYMAVRVYQAGQWQRYGWVQDFWDRQLYRQDPWICEAPNLCAYQYGAFFAWLAWRYGPRNSTLVYALPTEGLRRAYWNFLLSPWSWGRDPVYSDYDECAGRVEPNSAMYCVYRPVLPNRVYVFSSSLLINATGLQDRILIALVATRQTTADPSVTVSYCPEQATTTVTVTTTSTVTHTVTETHMTTVPTTYTTTVTLPVTQTHTTTTTVTVTETVAVPVTYTYTTTAHHTATVTETATRTTTTTLSVIHTTTETVTYTTTVTGQESGACMWCLYATLAVVILLVVCLVRYRNTVTNNKKRFNRYGSAVYT